MDIFVGSLPFKLDESELRALFEEFGEVTSVKLIINKATRMKKGFGFVEMPDNDQALKAITALNGTEVMGRAIIVNKSVEKKEETVKPAKKKQSVKNKVEEKKGQVWLRKLYPKKKKENVVDYPGIEEKKEMKKKSAGAKSARNFKVGGKKKR